MADGIKNFFRRNSDGQTSNNSSNDSLKTRMSDKLTDMKAKIEVNASKDMLAVARNASGTPGNALNAQKEDKSKTGDGSYKYKTDALIKMLDGLVSKFSSDSKTPKDIKERTNDIMARMHQTVFSAAFATNFQAGLNKAVEHELSRTFFMNGKAAPGKSQPADVGFGGQEAKILREVLSTLVTRMSPGTEDAFGVKKNRPNAADFSDRSESSQRRMASMTPSRDTSDINDARKSRAYHAKLGKAVKNIGGALKESARTTGAALRTYTEPARRDVALGGLQVAKGAAVAVDVAAKAAKDVVNALDVAQEEVIAAALAAGATVGTAVIKTGADLGKSTLRTAEAIATGTKDVGVHAFNQGKEARRAHKNRGQVRRAGGQANSEVASTEALSSAAEASTRGLSEGAQRPPLTRAATTGGIATEATQTRPRVARANTTGAIGTRAAGSSGTDIPRNANAASLATGSTQPQRPVLRRTDTASSSGSSRSFVSSTESLSTPPTSGAEDEEIK